MKEYQNRRNILCIKELGVNSRWGKKYGIKVLRYNLAQMYSFLVYTKLYIQFSILQMVLLRFING